MSNWFRTYGFGEILDGFLIGAYPTDADDVAMLQMMHVTRVLNLAEDGEYAPGERAAVREALAAAGIEERRVALTDYGELPAPQLEEAVATVREWLHRGDVVYTHCRAGWQRSAAVAAGVVALERDLDVEQALHRVKQAKPSADPLRHQRENLFAWFASRSPEPGPPRSELPKRP